MIAQVIYLLFGTGVFLSFINPMLGICFLTVSLLTYPETYAPLLEDYHINLVLSVVIFINSIARRIDFRKKNYLITFGIFLAFVFMSSFVGGFDDFILENYLYHYIKCFALIFIMITYINTTKELLLLINTCVIICSLSAIMAVYQVLFLSIERGYGFGDNLDPNVFSSFIIAFTPLAYYLFLKAKNKLFRYFYLTLFVFMITGVMASVSRAAFLAVLFIFFYIFIANIKKVTTILIVFIILSIFANFAFDKLKQRDTVQVSLSGKARLDHSASLRLYFWGNAINLWFRNPIFGVGTGNFPIASRKEFGAQRLIGVHNSWLQVLSENGIIAFILLITMLTMSFKDLSRLKKHEDIIIRDLAKYLMVGLGGMLICSTFIGVASYYFYWIVLTLPIVLENISHNKTEQLVRR